MASRSAHEDDLERTIRRCVREEMRTFSGGAQALLNRTRHLIQEASTSVTREIETNMSTAGSTGVNKLPIGGKRSVPGHPFRPLSASRKRRKGAKEPAPIPKSVRLIDCLEKDSDDEDTGEERDAFAFSERHIVIKGEFDLCPGHSEDEIRRELVEVFKTKIPTIRTMDFDFVKREKNIITLPVIKTGFKWDFAHVKNLCGQGRLYVKLNVPKDELLERGNSDDELSKPVFSYVESAPAVEENASCIEIDPDGVQRVARQSSQYGYGRCETSTPESSSLTNRPGLSHNVQNGHSRAPFSAPSPSPSTSSLANHVSPGPSSSHEMLSEVSQIESLRAIFPHMSEHDARSALLHYGSVNRAADALSSNEPNQDSSPVISVEDEPSSASAIFTELRKQMKHPPHKLRIDKEDLLSDAVCYYKDPDFDPRTRIRICSDNQVALDTGGVLRQFFSDVFVALSQNSGVMKLFQGEPKRRLPLFKSEHVMSGIFEILGKMIAHSLVQNGPGFPYLAPVVYSYISTGDLQAALLHVSAVDVCDPVLLNIIERIRDAPTTELSTLNQDSDFLQLMAESGETRLLTDTNKLDVVQSLITYSVLTKNKVLLDQMRKGLMILDVLPQIQKYPDLFEHLFVDKIDCITPVYVTELLDVRAANDGVSSQRCIQMLLSFIQNSKENDLADFLQYVTGSATLTGSMVPGSIKVSCVPTDSFYSSTCLMELKVPLQFSSYAQFESSLRAVIKGKSFTSA